MLGLLWVPKLLIFSKRPSKSWSDIISKNTGSASLQLSFHLPTIVGDRILVRPPAEVLLRGNQLWASSLVGYFLHSKLPYKVVEPIARRLWGNMGLSKVFLYDKGYYIFKFNSVLDRDNVLAAGPWHFASKAIFLQPWKPGVEFSKIECSKIPFWVKLSQIPYPYWCAEGISFIANAIGKPLFANDLTSKLDRIEVDIMFSFPSSINVVVLNEDNEEIISLVSIEYQSRPPSCPSCKVFGHSPLKCPKASYKWVPKVQVPESFGHAAPLDGSPAVLTKSPSPPVAPMQDEWTKAEKRKAISLLLQMWLFLTLWVLLFLTLSCLFPISQSYLILALMPLPCLILLLLN